MSAAQDSAEKSGKTIEFIEIRDYSRLKLSRYLRRMYSNCLTSTIISFSHF